MSPGHLMEWEAVVKSPFAVSLLLLAALVVVAGLYLMERRENRALNREFREHLRAEGDFHGVIENVREAVALVRDAKTESHADAPGPG